MERISLQAVEAAVKAAPTKIQGMLIERAILLSAFRLVENTADPKGPIDGKVHVDHCDFEPEVLVRAVAFFTATEASVKEEGSYFIISAEGYRQGPAGDH